MTRCSLGSHSTQMCVCCLSTLPFPMQVRKRERHSSDNLMRKSQQIIRHPPTPPRPPPSRQTGRRSATVSSLFSKSGDKSSSLSYSNHESIPGWYLYFLLGQKPSALLPSDPWLDFYHFPLVSIVLQCPPFGYRNYPPHTFILLKE